MNNRDRLYVEYHCTSCKRNHMISREAATDRATVKKCPHCLSPKVAPTGVLGFTATNEEIKRAVEKGLGLAKDIDDEQVNDTIHEMRVTTTEHQRKQIANNLTAGDESRGTTSIDARKIKTGIKTRHNQ